MLPLLVIVFTLVCLSPTSHSVRVLNLDHRQLEPPLSLSQYQCNETCGKLHIPFPFHLNTSCASVSNAFHLSCLNSSTLYLNIDSQSVRVLEFFSDGILVDFPDSTSTCRQYHDLNSFGFTGNDNFGIAADNVIGLYDCEDSSLCKADCETIKLPGCKGNENGSPACCYPLSDHSSWDFGDGFSVFSKFGCRGFSSWAVSRGSNTGKRGVKLEWAIPANSSRGACAANAVIVNATTVEKGIRCTCPDDFLGDGYATGVGCMKSCIKNGHEAYGSACSTNRHSGRTVKILAGVIGPLFILASLVALFYLLKRPVNTGTYDTDQAHFHSTISFRKACRTRLFTYQELEEATKGFENEQKLVDTTSGGIYAGVLGDGSHVAVHKVQCQDERDLIQVLSRIEVLSSVLHRSMARVLGCCIDLGHSPLLVYEYPANGTLQEHLQQSREQNFGLDWFKRLNIAAETASVLAFLQHEISPPIFHHDLKSGCILIDEDSSAKVAGFKLLRTAPGNEALGYSNSGSTHTQKTDVYDFGLLLMEIITGSNHKELPGLPLQKIKDGKLQEIVDPGLYYHEQPAFRREQIEIVADLATRCLLFGRDGRIGMIEVARELVHITKESIDGGSRRGPALEETFSNSSLLQMISMSPDSIYVP
ncbi:hypothetical protein Tsubulata_018317 [Turnera subulata]|uniref:Protein kinase domain-containing protein n=1 Tax=Turnera subulata TaxID=218843 RepID=A0A9Q0GJZ3_9ROSI|nr:hypothetical protein Tsubulata_018317 [Turnera subulata]